MYLGSKSLVTLVFTLLMNLHVNEVACEPACEPACDMSLHVNLCDMITGCFSERSIVGNTAERSVITGSITESSIACGLTEISIAGDIVERPLIAGKMDDRRTWRPSTRRIDKRRIKIDNIIRHYIMMIIVK